MPTDAGRAHDAPRTALMSPETASFTRTDQPAVSTASRETFWTSTNRTAAVEISVITTRASSTMTESVHAASS